MRNMIFLSKNNMFHIASLMAIVLIVGTFANVPGASAHNGPVHYQIVFDALRYMSQSPYATITQFAAVQDLLNRFTPSVSKILAEEAGKTDDKKDMYLVPDSMCWSAWRVSIFIGWQSGYAWDGHNFTALNHYQNAGRPGLLWGPQDGYYYFWSSRSGEDVEAMAHGVIDFCDIEVDNDNSLAIHRYRHPGFKGSNVQWDDNWEKDTRYTRFVPVASLAHYWYREYQRSHNIRNLGPTLHAAADITVPHHVLGSHGLRHQEYENWFETLYLKSGILHTDDALIYSHLTQRPFLTRGLGYETTQYPIILLYADMANYVLWYFAKNNSEATVYHNSFWDNYWAPQKYTSKRLAEAGHLLNLAVAATVRTIEAAFMESYGGNGDVYVAKSIGSTFQGSAWKWHDSFCYGEELPLAGDFNGDGKDDIVTFVRDTKTGAGRGDVHVALSTGSGFQLGQKWHNWFNVGGEIPAVGDFNGDGKDDIVTFVRDTKPGTGRGDVYVALSTGSGFAPAQKWHNWFCVGNEVPAVGDFDGDGKDDIVTFARHDDYKEFGRQGDVYVALSTGSSFQGTNWKWHNSFCERGGIPSVGNFNGVDTDGKKRDDIVCFIQTTQTGSGQGDVDVALSTGSGFQAKQLWHNWHSAYRGEVPAVGDFNGDGKDDVVSFVRDTKTDTERGGVWVALSTGSEFSKPSVKWHDWFCIRQEIPVIGDVTGESKDDIMAFTR